MAAIDKLLVGLKDNHAEDISFFGEKNEERLTGRHETASMSTFTHSVAGRHTSVRIPSTTYQGETGYFEDRRPAANMDPYLTCGRIVDSMILKGKYKPQFISVLQSFKEKQTNSTH